MHEYSSCLNLSLMVRLIHPNRSRPVWWDASTLFLCLSHKRARTKVGETPTREPAMSCANELSLTHLSLPSSIR